MLKNHNLLFLFLLFLVIFVLMPQLVLAIDHTGCATDVEGNLEYCRIIVNEDLVIGRNIPGFVCGEDAERWIINEGTIDIFVPMITCSDYAEWRIHVFPGLKEEGFYLTDPFHRKEITINGSTAGEQMNYQMKLTVHKGSGSDSGDNVYLNCSNRCRDDFSDIRFTKSDGKTKLEYWQEEYTSGDKAVFWIKFDFIPASPSSANFYIYYGNVEANSQSNGTNTFPLFFDDFSDPSLNPKWTVGGGGSIGVSTGGYAYPTSYGSGSGWHGPTMIANFSNNISSNKGFEMVTRFYWDGGSNDEGQVYLQLNNSSGMVYRAYVIDDNTSYQESAEYLQDTSGTLFSNCTANDQDCFSDGWHTVTFQRSGTNLKYWKDTTLRYDGSIGTQPDITKSYFLFNVYGGPYGDYTAVVLRLDSTRVRQYVSPEPNWGTWGSEELGELGREEINH